MRPSMSRGRPAFGCADSRAGVSPAMRSSVSSMCAGPMLQLMPMTSAPAACRAGANCSGGVPSRLLPSSSVVICATIGSAQLRLHRRNRRHDLVQVAERLEHEQIDAALDQRLRLLAEQRLGFVGAGLAPRLDAQAERTDRAGDIRRSCRRPLRASCAPATVDLAHLVGQAERRSLMRLAPNVLVSITSAPART